MSRFHQSSLLVALLLAAFLGLYSCATTGPGGKQSLIIIPASQEIAIGQGMADEIKKTETMLPDSAWQQYVTEVGQRIVAVCDRKDIEYHFAVIESDQINAFAAPGGFVYFYTGLLREMNSEAEMAAVMAHEISHVVARHGVKRLQAALGVQLAYELVFGDNNSQALQTAVGVGLGLAFSGYSRDNEREADKFGIYYMEKAGYDPQAAIDMFETLARLGGGGNQSVFEQLTASHPATRERIDNAKQELAGMKPLPPNLEWGRERYQKMVARLPASK